MPAHAVHVAVAFALGSPARRLSWSASRTTAAYEPLRKTPELFSRSWAREWFDPVYLEAHDALLNGSTSQFTELLREEGPGVYSFPFFAPKLCSAIMDEVWAVGSRPGVQGTPHPPAPTRAPMDSQVDNFHRSGLPARRPNSMNNYGIILNEIGLMDALSQLQQDHLLPIARHLFPAEGASFDSHHTFIVQYSAGQQKGLDMHTDDSDVTFNVCLGRDFRGAGLTFCGQRGDADHRQFLLTYAHQPGRAVVHAGEHRHGADDIEEGERMNLIMWNYNNDWRLSEERLQRQASYAAEGGPPDRRCLSFTHDRDYDAFVPPREQPEEVAQQRSRSKGWCPPPGKEYQGYGQCGPKTD